MSDADADRIVHLEAVAKEARAILDYLYSEDGFREEISFVALHQALAILDPEWDPDGVAQHPVEDGATQ